MNKPYQSTSSAMAPTSSELSEFHAIKRLIQKEQFDRISAISIGKLPTLRDEVNRTMIFYVQSIKQFEWLITHGLSIDHLDHFNQNPLFEAVSQSNYPLIDRLLDYRPAFVHQRDTAHKQPIHSVTSVETLDQLLSHRASIESECETGDRLIHFAARVGNVKVVDRLIEIGCNIYAVNRKGRTALHNACEFGQVGVIHSLLNAAERRSSNHSLQSQPNSSMHNSTDRLTKYVNQPDVAGWSPLHLAALGSWPQHESHASVITLLIQRGANIRSVDCSGLTPLHVCTDTPAARILVQADTEQRTLTSNNHIVPLIEVQSTSGQRPIHLASHENTIMLIEAGCVISPVDNKWRQPLHLVVEPDKVDYLYFKGADMNAVDCYGKTPLDWAVQTERPEVAEVIRKRGGLPGSHYTGSAPTSGAQKWCTIM